MNANGTLLVNGYGAGTLTTDSSGNVTATSDARLKNIDGDFTRGLADLKKISPKRYHWKKDSGLDPENQYAGLIAQDVQAAIPEAIGTTPQGTLSLSDRPLIAALINAAKELDARNAALEYRVTILSILTIGLFVAIIVAAVLASLRARS